MSCAKCLVPWEPQHEGVSCADFARWKEENNPDNQAAGLEQHLADGTRRHVELVRRPATSGANHPC